MKKLNLKTNSRDTPFQNLREKWKTRKESALENRFIPKSIETKEIDIHFIIDSLDIDEDSILEENRNQPKLFGKASKMRASAYKKVKLLDMELNVIKQDLSEDMKKNPKSWNLEKGDKLSDAAIGRLIYKSPFYLTKLKEYYEAKELFETWEWLIKAFEQRSTAIGRVLKERELAYNE